MRPLRGILPPVVTPFDSGALDLAAFEANLEAWAGEDLEGYVVLGSNGEAASLEDDEKLALVRAARARAGGRAVLVGTGLDSTRATIALTRRVADLGADAVLVLTPRALSRTVPGRVRGRARGRELCAAACRGLPRKSTARSKPAITREHAGCRPRTPLAVAVTATYGIAGLKAAVDSAGLKGGQVRAPLMPLGVAAREDIRALVAEASESWRAYPLFSVFRCPAWVNQTRGCGSNGP